MPADPQDITKIRELLAEGEAAAIEQAVALIETLGSAEPLKVSRLLPR